MLRAVALSCIASVATSSPQPQEVRTDGHGIAPVEETSRFYDCGAIRGTLRYRIERFEDVADIMRARRVTLMGIAINGRAVRSSELSAARQLFRRFGEIEALGSNCLNNHLDIRVFGITPDALAHALSSGGTAENELRTIRLSRDGSVSVR